MANPTEMVTENYCGECDNVVHAVFNIEDFYAFKVGLIRCNACGDGNGHIVHPCNECYNEETGTHYECGENCSTCPWKNAKVTDEMEEEDYVRWHKTNEPKTYELMLSGELGEYYKDLAKMIDKEDNEKEHKKETEHMMEESIFSVIVNSCGDLSTCSFKKMEDAVKYVITELEGRDYFDLDDAMTKEAVKSELEEQHYLEVEIPCYKMVFYIEDTKLL